MRLAQEKIERLYQSAMDLRDKHTVSDWPASDLEETRFRDAYLDAYNKTHDLAAFQRATRRYRKFLRKG